MVDVKWFSSPVIEKQKHYPAFISDEPINIIRSGDYHKVPMIIGYTSREGIYWDIYNRLMTGKPEIITDFTTVIPNNLNARKGSLLYQTIADRIKAFYWGPRLQQTRMGRHPRLKNMEPLYQLLTDVFFLRGIHCTVKNHYEMSPETPIYYYRFSFETKLNVFKQMLPPPQQWKYSGLYFLWSLVRDLFNKRQICLGAAHGDDINYIFDTYLTPEVRFGDIEDVAISRMVRMWTTFAQTGNPTTYMALVTGIEWKPIFKNCFQFLEYNERFQNDAFPDIDRMRFWDVIYQNDFRTKYL